MSNVIVILTVLGVLIGITTSLVIWTIRNKISPMPSSPAAKKVIFEALPKFITGQVIDLGSGWGTLIFPLAQHYRHCEVVGYETSPLPCLFSKIRHLLVPLDNLKIYRQDIFNVSLKDAELVVCYLYPEAMKKLKDKLENELQPGTWVISNTFAIPGWHEESLGVAEDIYHTKVYVYRIPKKQ